MIKSRPVVGRVYTFKEICDSLELRDSPWLGIRLDSEDHPPIQTSHTTVEQELSVPGFAETRWMYLQETSEWIPVFEYVDKRPVTDFVDIEVTPEGSWITLKGYPRDWRY